MCSEVVQLHPIVSNIVSRLAVTPRPVTEDIVGSYCLLSLSQAPSQAVPERQEKSTPVGMGYGRPWIDQWRLGP